MFKKSKITEFFSFIYFYFNTVVFSTVLFRSLFIFVECDRSWIKIATLAFLWMIFLLIFHVYHDGFGNHERRKKVHALSAWLPEKEVAICPYAIHTEIIVIVNSVVRHVTWIYEWCVYMYFGWPWRFCNYRHDQHAVYPITCQRQLFVARPGTLCTVESE